MELGTLYASLAVKQKMDEDKQFESFVQESVKRHASHDWGNVCDEDQLINNEALKSGERIISGYLLNETAIWVVTEADRSETLVLFPEERRTDGKE